MKVDKDLLKLYNIYSVSGTAGEKEICNWICEKLTELRVTYKRTGNTIYKFSNANKVLLSAHLDQVSTNGKAEHFYMQGDNIVGYNKVYQRTSLGADDKNGVWIILKLLEEGVNFDFIISEGEEVGCKGIAKIEEKLKKVSYIYDYCIVLDRKGTSEILERGSTGAYCKTLAYALRNFLSHTYTVGSGSISDTATISRYIESVNMSVAYDKAHTQLETTDYKSLCKIKEDVKDIIQNFVHYPSLPSDYIVTYSYTRTPQSSSSILNRGGRYYDYDNWI